MSWFIALGYTTVASATVLCLTHPIIILFINTVFLKEHTNKKAVLGIIMAFGGAAIITGGDYTVSLEALIGDFFAILGALFMVLYILSGRKYRAGINASVYVFLVFLSCFITFGIMMIFSGTPFTGYDGKTWLWIFMLAMVCQIGAHAVFNWCLGYIKAIYLATWETGEVIVAAAIAAVLFNEIPSLWQYVGGGITILGLIYYNRHETD